MLGKRIVGPRDVVALWDPAVNDEGTDAEAYAESLFDFNAGHVKIHEGGKPTIWRMGPLTEAQKRHAAGYTMRSPEWCDFVFRCSIHGVRDYLIQNEDGSEREITQPDRKDRPGMGEMASEEWLLSSGISMREIEGLAAVGWMISEAMPPLSKLSGRPAGP